MDSDKKTIILLQNLPQLQNFIKRDSESYKEEFLQQWQHFENSVTIFEQSPSEEQVQFNDLLKFLSHVVACYPDIASGFPKQLKSMLSEHYQILNPELRRTMVSSLILLKNKGLLDSMDLLPLFFTLFRCQDKQLRENLFSFIVHDIKNHNSKHCNNKLNKTLQNFMYGMLKDSHEIAALKSLDVIIDLYKRGIWCDERTVNILAEACFSESPKMTLTALRFFLEMSSVNTNENRVDSDDEAYIPTQQELVKMKHANLVNKKTKARKSLLRKNATLAKRSEKESNSRNKTFHFSALQLIHDPQGFVERLFSRLKQANATKSLVFETRLLIMNLISRLVGLHQLFLLNFYSYLLPFLQPHQKEITTILAVAAQASHALVPPSDALPMVKAIADKFIWGNGAAEVVVAGFNAIRMICERCPLAMEAELLQSLILEGKSYKQKGVGMAVKSLQNLYQKLNPALLARKDRGKEASMSLSSGKVKVLQYGQVLVESLGGPLEASKDEQDSESGDESSQESSNEENGEASKSNSDDESNEENNMDFIDPSTMLKGVKFSKHDKESRLATVMAGREDRMRFGSKKGLEKKLEKGSSLTNYEKSKKNKAFMMVVKKRTVVGKQKRSLRERQRVLKAHVKKQKMKKK